MECGMCANISREVDRYTVMRADNDNGIYWHLCRIYNDEIDGGMWYINSSHVDNPPGYREPNVYFMGGGFESYAPGKLKPIVEVYSLCPIIPKSELLAAYMKNI